MGFGTRAAWETGLVYGDASLLQAGFFPLELGAVEGGVETVAGEELGVGASFDQAVCSTNNYLELSASRGGHDS